MKISLSWLNDYVDVKEFFEKPEGLAELLTQAGLEVDEVENKAKDFANVVIGHVLKKEQHPNADKLSLCQVSTGQGVVHQIVCGAKNHKEDDRVVVALPGAVLPGNFEIKKSKIRGVESCGMMCSESELGLSSEKSPGIMILEKDAPIGKAYAEFAGLDEVVYEISVTPNRADCLSHFGLAREIGAILDREVKSPQVELKTSSESTQKRVGLEVINTELCPRYAGRFVSGVKIGPSPTWLKRRLEAVDVNSINNVVDITNYVMMELGQPLHAFDSRLIQGGKIVVDNAKEGESFTSLDGTEYKLDGTELMIRDVERPVALAGVVGSLNSGIQDDTQDVFIEAAYFVPHTVRKTARKHGIETDSGYRFSRGVDPEMAITAMDRASALMQELAEGTVYGEHHDCYPKPVERKTISIQFEYLEQRLGYKPDIQGFQNWMQRLGCEIAGVTDTGCEIRPPLFRVDMDQDVDLVEEYARLNGYDKIPETVPGVRLAPADHALEYELGQKLNELLLREGYQEAINYAFCSSKLQSKVLGDVSKMKPFGIDVAGDIVKIMNPLNEDLDVMRISLLPWLVQNAAHNSRHGLNEGRFFENGHVAEKKGDEYCEQWRLGMIAWGQKQALWQSDQKTPLVLEVKASIERLLKGLGGKSWQWRVAENAPDFLHPSQSAYLFFEGKVVGFVGTLHPMLQEEFKIREEAVVAEFNLEKLLMGQPRTSKIKPISRFPAVERDIALAMPKSMSAGTVKEAIRKAGGKLLQSVEVFDVFKGGNLAEDQKSLAFRLIYLDDEGTLNDDKIVEMQKSIIDTVTKKLDVTVR
jgi:phenylalanyl-tRNA synthetase beta chain